MSDDSVHIIMSAMSVAGTATLGELVDHCREAGTTPAELADTTRCRSCNALDGTCQSTAKVTGITCCKQCREWPMHGQGHAKGESA